jgi:hypothetical protein
MKRIAFTLLVFLNLMSVQSQTAELSKLMNHHILEDRFCFEFPWIYPFQPRDTGVFSYFANSKVPNKVTVKHPAAAVWVMDSLVYLDGNGDSAELIQVTHIEYDTLKRTVLRFVRAGWGDTLEMARMNFDRQNRITLFHRKAHWGYTCGDMRLPEYQIRYSPKNELVDSILGTNALEKIAERWHYFADFKENGNHILVYDDKGKSQLEFALSGNQWQVELVKKSAESSYREMTRYTFLLNHTEVKTYLLEGRTYKFQHARNIGPVKYK